MNNLELKEKAILLRKKGFSYSYIANVVKVPKSTLSYWLAEIPYIPNEQTVKNMNKARLASALTKAKARLASVEEAKTVAKSEIGNLSRRDLFMLGIGLYLGEGSKHHNQLRFINSDPKIMRLIIRWFKEVSGLQDSNFKIRIHIYPDCNKKKVINYWSQELQLPINHFYECYIDQRVNKKAIPGKLPYGTAHLTVKSNGKKEYGVFFARKIHSWIHEVLK